MLYVPSVILSQNNPHFFKQTVLKNPFGTTNKHRPSPTQVVTGRLGSYTQINVQKSALTVREFHKMANSATYHTPPHDSFEDLERRYWKNITYVSPIYAADVCGSLTDPECDVSPEVVFGGKGWQEDRGKLDARVSGRHQRTVGS